MALLRFHIAVWVSLDAIVEGVSHKISPELRIESLSFWVVPVDPSSTGSAKYLKHLS